MSSWIDKDVCGNLSLACRSLAFVEFYAGGAGDAARVGDRFLSPVQQTSHSHLQENLVEGIFEEMRRFTAEEEGLVEREEQPPASDVGFVTSQDGDASMAWSRVADSSGILAEWKATEAEMQTLADRADVAGTIAIREYKVPGASRSSSALDFVLSCFMSVKRPIARERVGRRRRGKQSKESRGHALPALGTRVVTLIFDFVGALRDDDGELTVIGNAAKHIQRCTVAWSLSSAVRSASYGWQAGIYSS
eukprot:s444_g55.t1